MSELRPLSRLLQLSVQLLDHFLLFCGISFRCFRVLVHALHGALIGFALLVQFLYDLLCLRDRVSLDVKLSSQLIQMRLQLEVLFISFVDLFKEVLLDELEGFLSLLVFEDLLVQLGDLALHVSPKARVLGLLAIRLVVESLHLDRLGSEGLFAILDQVAEVELLTLQNVELSPKVVEGVFEALPLIENTADTEVLCVQSALKTLNFDLVVT